MPKKHYSSAISSIFGKFARYPFPSPIQRFVNKSYVGLMGLDMSEFDTPESYHTLNALFTRALKVKREIDNNPKSVISPCDALITDTGIIEEGRAYQIKGMSYSTKELLSSEYKDEFGLLEGGSYTNFYLSPKDYHRYHSPFDIYIDSITHIPGKLYPVNMPLLKKKVNLFIENERVVIRCRDSKDRVHFIVLVGALNVGKMVVLFEDRIHTNSNIKTNMTYRYKEPKKLSKGELFGWFEMGSTIVMLSEREALRYSVKVGDKVKFAQTIGYLED